MFLRAWEARLATQWRPLSRAAHLLCLPQSSLLSYLLLMVFRSVSFYIDKTVSYPLPPSLPPSLPLHEGWVGLGWAGLGWVGLGWDASPNQPLGCYVGRQSYTCFHTYIRNSYGSNISFAFYFYCMPWLHPSGGCSYYIACFVIGYFSTASDMECVLFMGSQSTGGCDLAYKCPGGPL